MVGPCRRRSGSLATWTPVSIDLEPEPAVAASDASEPVAEAPLPKAVTVRAREVRTRDRTVTLEVAAPTMPGAYRLQVTMLDAGRRPLPSADRPSIRAAVVRVWADRAVAYDLRSTADGDGVTLRVTNTGAEPIPAQPDWGAAAAKDPEELDVRSAVTLTATSGDPARPSPIVLLHAPLAEDLAPGATLVFHVRGIEEATLSTRELAVRRPPRAR